MTIAIIDYSQTIISAVSVIAKDLKGDNAADLIKHCALNQILKLKKKFGTLVFAVDSRKGYWRRDKFPAYKGQRKHERDKNDFLDFELVGRVMDEFKQELIDNFQYKIIEVPKAEADDIIAVISKYHLDNELETSGLFEEPQEIVIVSSDKDFHQLLKYKHVKCYDIINDVMYSG
jgi:5'-3' exonuclease